MKFQNQVAIITGSTKGIGKATALLMAAEGAKVVIVGTTEEEMMKVRNMGRKSLEEVVAKLNELGLSLKKSEE